jgi:hypothetical protein
MIVSLWTYISGCPVSVPGPCDEDIRQPADIDQGTGLHLLPQGRLAARLGDMGGARIFVRMRNNRSDSSPRVADASAVNRLSPVRGRAQPIGGGGDRQPAPTSNRRHTASMGEPGSFGTEKAGVAGFGHAAALPLGFPVGPHPQEQVAPRILLQADQARH